MIIISIVTPEQRLCYIKIAAEVDTINAMVKTLNEIKSLSPLDIVEKKKCVALYNGTWQRGLISSESPLKVKLIDCGIEVVVRPNDVREIPSVFATISPFVSTVGTMFDTWSVSGVLIAFHVLQAHAVKLPSVSLEQLVRWEESAEVVSIKPTAQVCLN